MLERVAQFMNTHAMTRSGETLIVAVSGGPDSLCLLHILRRLREQLDLTLHVAHVDHMLRPDSADDAAFVREIAGHWGVPATIETTDVRWFAASERLNLHDAARRARYSFFAHLADQLGASAVAVAHTADDQAETVLMHLLRGAGTEGLAGMRPVTRRSEQATNEQAQERKSEAFAPIERPSLGLGANALPQQLIRPLLGTTRTKIEAYCAEYGLEPRHDTTNAETIYTRNRIRHDLLPLLMSYNPHVIEALGRTAAICADDAMFIRQALDDEWSQLARVLPNSVTLDGAQWRTLHPALQRAALRRAYALLGANDTLGWDDIERARALTSGGVGKRLSLPGGIRLHVGYHGSLTLGEVVEEGPQLAGGAVELPVPGQLALADNWMIEARVEVPSEPLDHWGVLLEHDLLEPPIIVRRRQAGDRIRPAGGRGSRSLQNLFVDAKVPRTLRDDWPILADTRGIVWVPGLCVAQGYQAHAETERAVWIQISRTKRNE